MVGRTGNEAVINRGMLVKPGRNNTSEGVGVYDRKVMQTLRDFLQHLESFVSFTNNSWIDL